MTKSRRVYARKHPQASASVCKRSRSVGPGSRKSSRKAEMSSLLGLHVSRGNSHGDRSGSWSRNAELSSLLDLRCVFASQKCQQSRGSQWVVVAKRRTGVTFGLALRLRVSKVSTISGIAGGRGRETQNCCHVWTCCVGKMQNCRRHFWTCVASSRLKSVNNHGDRSGSWSRNAELSSLLDLRCIDLRVSKVSTIIRLRGVVAAERRTVITLGLAFGLRVSKKSTITAIAGGRGRQTPHLSSLLDLRCVFASQKSQQSRRSGGRACETQNCRHFWTCVWSSHLKSVNSHRDGGPWSQNAELSSLLDSVAKRRREERGDRREERERRQDREERGERRQEKDKRRGGKRKEREERQEER